MEMPIYLSRPGVICTAGNSVEQLWQSTVTGNQSGIKKITATDEKKFCVGRIEDAMLTPSKARYDMRIMRIEQMALTQIENAINRAKKMYGANRIAVCVGSCDNGTEFSEVAHRRYFTEGKFPENYSLEIQSADYVATFVNELYNLNGITVAFNTACSSSAGAIIKAAELIRAGIVDAAIAGGVDVASPAALLGFDSLEAISSEVTNPFSKNRRGITLGEGAAFFVLAKDADVFAGDNVSASAGAFAMGEPRITLAGYGESADAHHITSPDPSGDGAERAMREALAMAQLQPSDIGYVNLHGTGTKHNDVMEANAMKRVFGENGVPCSSTKPLTGHTLGAASAIEAAVCWAALANAPPLDVPNIETKLPMHVWDGVADEELPSLALVGKSGNVANGGRVSEKPLRYCMSNSFAFGGANASLIFGKE